MVMVDKASCPQRHCNLCDKYRKELEERDKGCPFCLDEFEKGHKDLYSPDERLPRDEIYAYIHYDEEYREPLLSIHSLDPEVWGVAIDIMYCPICGKKLRESWDD